MDKEPARCSRLFLVVHCAMLSCLSKLPLKTNSMPNATSTTSDLDNYLKSNPTHKMYDKTKLMLTKTVKESHFTSKCKEQNNYILQKVN